MPWAIRPEGDKFKVVNKETGHVAGTHDTHDEALAQLRALYANVKEAAEISLQEFLEETEVNAALTFDEFLAANGDPEITLEQYQTANEETLTFEEFLRKNFSLQGEQGPKGDRGQRGPRGEAGKDGQTGPQGVAGPRGLAGADGRPGAAGRDGIQGPPGPEGPPGRMGQRGYPGRDGKEGPPGPRGIQGPPGRQGPSGPRGEPGNSLTVPANAAPDVPSLRTLGFNADEAAPGNHWHHMPESQHARRHGLRQNIDPIFPMQGTALNRVLAFDPGSPEWLKWIDQSGGTGGGASLSDNTPQTIGTPATAGIGGSASRDDHVHAHGSFVSGDFHPIYALHTDVITTHGGLSGVTANQHHNQSHAISGADHTGTIGTAQHGDQSGASGVQEHGFDQLAGSLGTAQHGDQSSAAGIEHGFSQISGSIGTAQHGSLSGPSSAHRHSDLATVGANDHHNQLHNSAHVQAGGDTIYSLGRYVAAPDASQGSAVGSASTTNPQGLIYISGPGTELAGTLYLQCEGTPAAGTLTVRWAYADTELIPAGSWTPIGSATINGLQGGTKITSFINSNIPPLRAVGFFLTTVSGTFSDVSSQLNTRVPVLT